MTFDDFRLPEAEMNGQYRSLPNDIGTFDDYFVYRKLPRAENAEVCRTVL